MKEKIIIVDKNDNIIGSKERGTLDYEKDIYRVAALWIVNFDGSILLARRAFTKKQHPGKWGPAVAGTVEEGEDYESNIIKESEEELGLTNIAPEKWIKNDTIGKYKYQHFTQWYILKLDEDLDYFKPRKEEVAEIKWFTKEEVIELSESDEVIDSIKEIIKTGLIK